MDASHPLREGVMEKEWERLVRTVGAPLPAKATYYPDVRNLNANFLIASIDHAFLLRDSLSWCRQLDKELFFEYILPYRIRNESPHDWQKHLFEKMRMMRDTATYSNSKELIAIINDYIGKYIRTSRTMWNYPFDFTAEQIEGIGMGACPHRVLYATLALRANGFAVAIDYTPTWANLHTGHEWCVLMDAEPHHPFDGASPNAGMTFQDRKVAKVFRNSFQKVISEFPKHKDIPSNMLNKLDVTDEYVNTTDIVVELPKDIKDKQYALIGTFNNRDWAPQYPGLIKSGKAEFKKMGRNIVYMTLLNNDGALQNVGDPFLVDSLGNIHYFNADTENTCDMMLYRKYPMVQRIETFMSWMIGGCFVGSNRTDHKDSVLLFEIIRRPDYFETAIIDDPRSFRYLRYVATRPMQDHAAELEFYGLAENGIDTVQLKGTIIGYPKLSPESTTPYANAFDGNTVSYSYADGVEYAWLGMDFGKPQRIVKIRYCPRSDANFIEPGDEYELCYWKNGGWVSCGRQVATKHYLTYKNIPSGALYLLHNHTKGKEERIFTYENGKQVWW